MAEEALGDKERIQILLAEYNSLRGEINARVSNAYQVSAITAGAIAWFLQQPIGPKALAGAGIGVIGILISAWFIFRDCFKAGLRVQQLETEINRRAGEKLLVWENELGGLAAGYWQLDLLLSFLKLRRPGASRHPSVR